MIKIIQTDNGDINVGTDMEDMVLCMDVLLEAVFIMGGSLGAQLNLTDDESKDYLIQALGMKLERPLGTLIKQKNDPTQIQVDDNPETNPINFQTSSEPQQKH